jgi:peptide/nickel transport system ATP-binding protein
MSNPATAAERDVSTDVLHASGLCVSIGGKRLVQDVEFDLRPGEIVGLLGESGSGKTLTGLSVLGLLPPGSSVRGKLEYGGENLLTLSRNRLRDIRGRTVSMIFQEPKASLNPSLPVGRQIRDVIRSHEEIGRAAADSRVEQLLREVALPDPRSVMKARPWQLSGGMCQRVMIAMALACDPRVLIADEPTTALDATVQAAIIRLLRRIARERALSVLLISHNLGVVSEVCDRAVVMYCGEVVQLDTVDGLLNHPRHPYSWSLLRSALPEIDDPRSAHGLDGPPANAARPPEGCRFHPRCGFAVNACVSTHPALEKLPDGTAVRCLRHRELDLTVSVPS